MLYSFKLTIGRMAIAGRKMYTNEAIAALVPLSADVTTEYLHLALSTVRPDAPSHAVKGLTLNSRSLSELNVPVIPRERQGPFVRAVRAELAAAFDLGSSQTGRLMLTERLPSALLGRGFESAVS